MQDFIIRIHIYQGCLSIYGQAINKILKLHGYKINYMKYYHLDY